MIRNYITKRWISFLTVTAVLLTIIAPAAIAQDNPQGGLNLEVSPTPLFLETQPGKSISQEIKIKNSGLTTERIGTSLMKFGAEGDEGSPELLDIEPNDPIASWVTFSEETFDIEPGVWKTITMTVNPPAEAAFGYYFAIIFSRVDGSQAIEQGQANLLGAVADLVLLDVQAPGAKREAKLVEFSMPNKVYEFLPTDFNVRLQNTGNVHIAPRGNIFVSRGGSGQDALLEVNPDKGYILPNSFRKFTTSWNDGYPAYKVKEADGKTVLDENGNQKRFLDWSNFNPSKIRIGKYTAKVVMVYNDGSGDVPVEGTVSFWVIPWRILGVLALTLLLVGAGVYALVGRPIRNRLKKNKE